MKNIIATVLLAFVGFVSAMAQDTNKEEREISEFTAIEASKGLNIMLVQCDHYGLEVVTQGCPTSDVETTVKKGKLVVKMKKVTKGSAVSVYVYFTDIDAIYLKSAASVETVAGCHLQHRGSLLLDLAAKCEAQMEVDVDELVVSSNSCTISLSGKAVKQKVEIAGTVQESKYDAISLYSEDVDIYASGCDSEVWAMKTLKAEAVGCTITYKGDAKVVSETSSNGKVEKF